MSLFQCAKCGCCENTALTSCGHAHMEDYFDWTGIEEWRGSLLCSACAPTRYSDGTPVTRKAGKWHDQFDRVFLPKGEFHTNREGNLQHTKTKSTDFRSFAIDPPVNL